MCILIYPASEPVRQRLVTWGRRWIKEMAAAMLTQSQQSLGIYLMFLFWYYCLLCLILICTQIKWSSRVILTQAKRSTSWQILYTPSHCKQF